MNNSFLAAAASYYGLSLDQVQQDSEIDTSTGEFIAVMRILMTPEDLIGVAQRMKVMREEEAQSLIRPAKTVDDLPTDSQMRDEYNAMDKNTKSKYGAFSVYKTARVLGAMSDLTEEPGILNRKVEHIDVPEDSEQTDMRVVALPGSKCSDAQKNFAVDYDDDTHKYLIQWAMLTDEQKAQVADLSGGLPG